jgi:hypothetical protein
MVMDSNRIIERVIDESRVWCFKVMDPWDKSADFSLRDNIKFPVSPGVYIFVDQDTNDIYYIGKAGNGLHARLRGKLRSDYRSRNTFRRVLKSGLVMHEYPYLAQYQCHKTVLYAGETNYPKEAESVLLAAHKFMTSAPPLRIPAISATYSG